MGPTNIALVQLFQAEQALREAQGRLDSASKGVRVQERKVTDLEQRLASARTTLREQQSKGAQFDLDIKSRDAHIEKLRNQQQAAKNNKEYQAFLIEINTEKVDKVKVEDESLKVMEAVEKLQAEVKDLTEQLGAEQGKLETMRAGIGDQVKQLQAEIDTLKPRRDEAAARVPQKARDPFERLAGHMEGEAMAAIYKPDRRREEYACAACMMDLVTDVYNKLHSRDELVFCPSCRRILYIPEDLPVEAAIKQRKPRKEPSEIGAQAPRRGKGPEIGAATRRGELASDVLESITPDVEESSSEANEESMATSSPDATERTDSAAQENQPDRASENQV